MYHPNHIIELLGDNIRKTRNPFGLSGRRINSWWKKADLPQNGHYQLFTGLMYQMLPYIEAATGQLEKWEDTKPAAYLPWMRYLPKSLMRLGLNVLTPAREKKRSQDILITICQLLCRSGVEVGYRPELDFYSGILLYDLGDVDGFIEHSRWVLQKLQENKVSRVITVDPHTTYALKVLYPRYLEHSLEVSTYFELLQLQGNGCASEMAIHDSCFYGRYLQVSDIPRRLLSDVGVLSKNILTNGKYTHCCGGPAESVSPSLAKEISGHRVTQLQETQSPVVSMCPICFANLRKSGIEVHDLASVLAYYAR